ncbi:Holliday junction resolvase RuvX [Leptolyngbyaceae cyanobacterium CCMR0082]|uniref:Putative pre-16S rRNA nuclease n=2 Tax=Adonisia turfae TaxID=2950184 RepID=A0A6M0SG34_9CYAN|nr:Holliday junction resolvase RuvX [Adonisia turfae]MDV3350361.1 Holliday junction resolvase RuvX [Leptothoe sp. LEGE 181152]NEZ58837.1 Holliday junction resolvase RuvX [Adonisia turfae CCMR0081]NEZ66572.1 Holliday junction resolvase RuvX [Adonisia turfae CCMR0082]
MISVLGLDIGSRRIGVAGCDRTGLIATGLTTIENKSFVYVTEQLRQLVRQREATLLVVGLPYTLDGTKGAQAKRVQKFTKRLAKALSLPVAYVDERLTSVEAEQQLQAERRPIEKNKGLIDRRAAAIILQQWLDSSRADRPS